MSKNLIFLESATKKKTIQSFLGEEYVIFATQGHLCELKKSGMYNLGVDLENFSPTYEIIPEKKNIIQFWKNYLEKEKYYRNLPGDRPRPRGRRNRPRSS